MHGSLPQYAMVHPRLKPSVSAARARTPAVTESLQGAPGEATCLDI